MRADNKIQQLLEMQDGRYGISEEEYIGNVIFKLSRQGKIEYLEDTLVILNDYNAPRHEIDLVTEIINDLRG